MCDCLDGSLVVTEDGAFPGMHASCVRMGADAIDLKLIIDSTSIHVAATIAPRGNHGQNHRRVIPILEVLYVASRANYSVPTHFR